MFSKMNEG